MSPIISCIISMFKKQNMKYESSKKRSSQTHTHNKIPHVCVWCIFLIGPSLLAVSYLIAVPQALHRGMRAPPKTAGRLLASPALPTRICLGPVGIWGCHVPGFGGEAGATGAGAGWDTGDLPVQHARQWVDSSVGCCTCDQVIMSLICSQKVVTNYPDQLSLHHPRPINPSTCLRFTCVRSR